MHQESTESHSGMAQTRIWCLGIEPRLVGGWAETHRGFPKWTMVKWGFSTGIYTDVVHSKNSEDRSAGTGTATKYNAIVTGQFCNCAKEALRITKPKMAYWRWYRKKNDSIVKRQFCNCTKEALCSTLVEATGTVRLFLSVRMERMSPDADKRRSLLACTVVLLLSTWKQNEQRSETAFWAWKNN